MILLQCYYCVNTRDEFRNVSVTDVSVTEADAARKADLIGNCKWVTTSRKFTVGYNVAKVVGATSTGDFL